MDSFPAIKAAAAERSERLAARLRQAVPDLDLAPLLQATAGSENYTAIPELIAEADTLLADVNGGLRPDFHKYLLMYRIAHFDLGGGRYALPASIAPLYLREFARIVHQTDSFDDAFFDLSNDAFLKDLAIVSHRLIPVGAEFAQGGDGIPRRLLFSSGIGQCLRLLWTAAFTCGGFKPFFSLHAHVLSLEDFNDEGWQATYRRLAELLELNPGMKGWLSASWFLDPALDAISPHLAHLRRVPADNGGLLLFVAKDPQGHSGALSRSPTRRRLFAEGKYVPGIYMRVWPRRAVIAWSRSQDDRAAVARGE